MIELQEVVTIHEVLMQEFGGLPGVRDQNLLQSAIERPFSGFGETAFYATPEAKAGAILESLIKNHPFIDGNKRTGYVLMRLILMQFGKDLTATQDEKYSFIMQVASEQVDFEQIVAWIAKRVANK
jgi:death-on-curing protein